MLHAYLRICLDAAITTGTPMPLPEAVERSWERILRRGPQTHPDTLAQVHIHSSQSRKHP